MAARTARKTTPAQRDTAKTAAKKTTTAKKTPSRPPRRAAAKKTTPRLALVTPEPSTTEIDRRTRDFITDAQIYATHAAKQAGIPVHRIREWTDHQDGTATRALRDGTLHYTHETRTLTWQTTCRMGAVHTYTLDSRAAAAAARVQAATCEELHADLSNQKPLTANELEAAGLLQTPTWARPDILGDDFTDTKVIPDEPINRATASAADTQPLSRQEIAEGIAARTAARAADSDTAKEHPQT
jgi:hypothetical protein